MSDKQQAPNKPNPEALRLQQVLTAVADLEMRLAQQEKHLQAQMSQLLDQQAAILALLRPGAPATPAATATPPVSTGPSIPPPPAAAPDAEKSASPATGLVAAPIRTTTTTSGIQRAQPPQVLSATGVQSVQAPPRQVPYHPEVVKANDLAGRLRLASDNFLTDPVTPKTRTPIETRMKAQIAIHKRNVLDAYSAMHDEQLKAAQAIYDESLKQPDHAGKPLSAFWQEDAIAQYASFRTEVCLELLLDELEKDIKKFDEPAYYEIVDHYATMLGLERLPVQAGSTTFDANLHDVQTGGTPASDARVIQVIRSGFRDLESKAIQRKILVKVNELRGEASRPRPGKLEDSNVSVESLPKPKEPLVAAEELSRCQSYTFKLKMSVLRLTGGGTLPNSKTPLHPAIATALKELSTNYLRGFLTLSKEAGNDEQAQALHYYAFRTKRFMEEFLDKLEAEIRRHKLEDHLAILNHLSVDLDIGTIGVVAGKTDFNPERHELPRGEQQSGSQKLWQSVITEVLRTGYTDLRSSQIIRRSLVKCRIKTGNDQYL